MAAINRVALTWRAFTTQESLSKVQREQFERYLDELLAWNENMNLTAITDPVTVIRSHFQDSLALDKCIDMASITGICDVGAGGGFPGIPLKIKYPHLALYLVEVNAKKVQFLESIVELLGLEHVFVVRLDWRTFLRKTEHDIQLFLARASLRPDELTRMFRPGCFYKDAHLVYWASSQWELEEREQEFFLSESFYSLNHKKRKLMFFGRTPLDLTC